VKVVTCQRLLTAIVLLAGVAGCGSSAKLPRPASSPAVIATSTASTASTLPFTQPSAADARFVAHLDARCRAIISTLDRLAQPATLSDQASFSDHERQMLVRLHAAVTPLSPPADLTQLMRSYTRALLSVIDSDEFVADAARAQDGEGVAYWLSKRAAAINVLKHASGLLGAVDCMR